MQQSYYDSGRGEQTFCRQPNFILLEYSAGQRDKVFTKQTLRDQRQKCGDIEMNTCLCGDQSSQFFEGFSFFRVTLGNQSTEADRGLHTIDIRGSVNK